MKTTKLLCQAAAACSNKVNIVSATSNSKVNLMGLPLPDFSSQIMSTHRDVFGNKSYKVKQMYTMIYQHGVTSFDQMTTLTKQERATMDELYEIDYGHEVEVTKKSQIDSTIKYLLTMRDSKKIESVLMEFDGRRTMCLSSQIGCSLNCRFCKTGTQPIERNLTSAEIVGQVMLARHELKNFPLAKCDGDNRLSHLVFMGEGEPLYNYRNVSKAIKILTDPAACGFSKRKVTVSTSGVVNLIKKCSEELDVELAISLHATTNEMRDYLVPLNKTFPLEVLFDTLRSLKTRKQGITFEYVMLDHVNDFIDDARRLVQLVKGVTCSINLIAFNEWEGSGFTCSSEERINDFSQYLYSNGIPAPIRFSKGQDIDAACGQLKSSEKFKESFLRRLDDSNRSKITT